ncbi:PAS domain-containing sensor histidine kinase [Flaviramulus sp. BrNp1-15]|uniref:PAS domain-containing sensor histidine kinase n=1 Tax=Flaviramulus sp. BrNp1-15 TaxID=2916754 RepID=UPI001EE86683|nr:PAS domain-containing sensor histidine kinase [Flaviramulus sp. BrNp1-15]ULC60861.1 PAS domain-containing sensor histidine kinase [Flaviramulus sp. BrNp1-15]
MLKKVTSLLKSEVSEKNHSENLDVNIKWQEAVDISNIGVWDFDALKNKVYFSESSKRIIGYENDNTFGKNIDDWNNRVHPEDKEKYFKDYQDHINGLKPLYINEHRVKCKDGSYKWILDKGKIIKWDTNGKPIRFIGTHVDITSHVESEKKLSNTLNLVSKQNNKLKNFAHIVTHNLKQHAGNFESLLDFYEEAKTEAEKQELIEYLKTLSASLTKTISNLNEIVSIQNNKATKIEKLYLAKEANKILEMLKVVITESNAIININIDPKLYIYYNPTYMESIIQNLLTNAIKYKHPERDPKVNVDAILTEDYIKVIVSDNGIGINLDKFGDSVFGLYKTFHNNKNSEGVGLYLIKNQIETYGGEITLDSEVNVGTTFTITIPNKKNPA